jgi:hypothetical protein
MVTDAPEALMNPGTSIALIAAMTAGCSLFADGASVRSATFPWIDIRCEGDAQVSGNDCLLWAEQSLADRRSVAVQARSVIVAFAYADDGARCSASTSFYRPNGNLVLTVGATCPVKR